MLMLEAGARYCNRVPISSDRNFLAERLDIGRLAAHGHHAVLGLPAQSIAYADLAFAQVSIVL